MPRKEYILTLTVTVHKRSSVNKVKRFVYMYQHYKNSFYILIREYYKRFGDIAPFLKKRVLKKLVYNQIKLANFKDEDYYTFIKKGFEIFGADTIKAIVNQLHQELRSCVALATSTSRLHLPKPKKLNKCKTISITLNPNMYNDQRLNKRKQRNRLLIRPMKGISFTVSIPSSLFIARSPTLVYHREGYITIHIPYKVSIINSDTSSLENTNWLSIDLGINNMVSIISNIPHLRSILVNGKPYKTFNQWINKLFSKLQSVNEQEKYHKLWKYRKRRLDNELNRIANFVIQIALKFNINVVILPTSLTKSFSQESKLSKKFNQTFHQLPLGQFIKKIKFKAQLFGIKVIEVDEAYTSKLSAITDRIEEGQIESNNSSRVKRGLFKDCTLDKVFNADLNGALNIAIKALGPSIRGQFLELSNWLDKLCRPVKLLLQKYSASEMLQLIADSTTRFVNLGGLNPKLA